MFARNQCFEMTCESFGQDAQGVCRHEGMAVFVPGLLPGERALVRIVKPEKRYAFGRVEKLLTAGPGRVRLDCPVAGPCGGCGLRHISYEAECAAKTQFVRDAFARLGKLDVRVREVLAANVHSANIPCMVVTMGGQGAVYARANGESGVVPAKKVDVIDTTGAGDAFFAGTVIGLTYGKNLAQSCEIGSRLAASVICITENVCPRFRPLEFGLDVPVVD